MVKCYNLYYLGLEGSNDYMSYGFNYLGIKCLKGYSDPGLYD